MSNRNDHWDLIIESKGNLLDLQLKELWRYRDLLVLLVRRDFVAFFKQTVLGPIWFFIQPIITTIIFVFVFGNLANISTDGIPAPGFYLCGIIAWTYFSDCLVKTSNVFRDNASIFGKVYFPRLIMPFSIVVSNLMRFGVQLMLLLILLGYYFVSGEAKFSATSFIGLFPVFIVLMAVQALGFGMIISAMTTKYRDLALLVSFAMPLLMYATPVIYPLSTLSGNWKLLISANPMTHIIEGMRLGFFGKGEFGYLSFIYLLVSSFFILVCGIVIFNKVEKSFVDTV